MLRARSHTVPATITSGQALGAILLVAPLAHPQATVPDPGFAGWRAEAPACAARTATATFEARLRKADS
jgi:hypothetical protein